MTAKLPLVLYTDDDPSNRVVFEYAFRNEFRLETAESGAAALEVLAAKQVAVVVSDIRMTAMSGDRFLRIVKEFYPTVIRVVIAAFEDLDPILRAISDGLVSRYLIKPWDRDEVTQVLRWATEAWLLTHDSASLNKRLHETERLVTLGSLTGAMVHSFKQPLAGLDLNTMQLAELAKELSQLRSHFNGSQLGDADRDLLARRIDDLVEIASDLCAGTVEIGGAISALARFLEPAKAASADPLPVVRDALLLCRDLAMQARGRLVYEGPDELPHVRLDAGRLAQLLVQLITNGVHALKARGTTGGRVVVRAHAEHQHLVLEVIDDGRGMPADALAKVGAPFFTTRDEGTGLGVAQCQRIVGAAGGRFQIASNVSTGTTVTLSLPVAEPIRLASLG